VGVLDRLARVDAQFLAQQDPQAFIGGERLGHVAARRQHLHQQQMARLTQRCDVQQLPRCPLRSRQFRSTQLKARRRGFVPESRGEQATGRFDWLGSLVVAVAVAGLAFGTIRGQQHGWSEPIAMVSLAVGAVAAIAFPLLMTRRRDPLVPPRLFRSRNFTVTNISTFVIYGALYVTLTFLGIFMIGTLGYNEQAAGIALVPSSLFLVLFSSRIGKLAARFGPRLFMSLGPAIMALGLLWLARIPADSQGWMLGGDRSASIVPPADYFTDLLPGLVVFGIGLSIMVAPLTTALMTSVPARNSGVASAINNAISRVGSPLVNALIFVAVAASFYATIGQQVPEVDTGSRAFRNAVAPLNQPSADVPPEVRAAAQQASTKAFHLAMLVAVGLLMAGAAVNGFGIRNPAPAGRHPGPGAEQPPPESGSGTPGGPVPVGAEEFGKQQPHATCWPTTAGPRTGSLATWPPCCAREAMVTAGVATAEDLGRWERAFAATATRPATFFAPMFTAIGRRPT
jgi:Major Facilitator Superfamily